MSDELTPSQRIIADANRTTELTDSTGRKIKVKSLSALDTLKLYRAIGATHSANGHVYYISSAAACVTHIDGVRLLYPQNQDDIDATVEKLGDAGMARVMFWMKNKMEATEKAAKEASEADGEEDPLA